MAQHQGRSPWRWAIFLAVAVSLFTLLWVAWSLADRHVPAPWGEDVRSDSTVAVGLRDAPKSLDIRTERDRPVDQALLDNVYETLVGVDGRNRLHASLASSWKTSSDGLTYTFTMRRAITFSNGDALDASDAVWSLQQAIPQHRPGVETLGKLTNVANPDAHTLVLTLGEPNPRLLRALSGPIGIVFDRDATINYTSQAMGSGPFVVAAYTPGSSITLRRNPKYAGPDPASSQVTLRYFATDDAVAAALHKGEIQMGLPDTIDLERLRGNDSSLSIAQDNGTRTVLIGFNADPSSIFSDQRVRQATRHLIDVPAAINGRHDVATRLGGPIGPLEPGYEDLTGLFPHDSAEARSMLSYFSTQYLGTVVFLVPQEYRDLGETLTQQLEQDGAFRVDMQVVDNATMATRLTDGNYTIALTTLEGDESAGTFANADSVFRYTNGTAQRQYRDALASTNDKDYQSHLREFARTVSQDAAADWLYVSKDQALVQSRLEGYQVAMSGARLRVENLQVK